MGFQVILIDLESHIFTSSPTFHGTTIENHDLKIIEYMDVTIDLFGNVTMNKVMGSTTVLNDDEFPFFDVTN
jgi:hypothetical protein